MLRLLQTRRNHLCRKSWFMQSCFSQGLLSWMAQESRLLSIMSGKPSCGNAIVVEVLLALIIPETCATILVVHQYPYFCWLTMDKNTVEGAMGLWRVLAQECSFLLRMWFGNRLLYQNSTRLLLYKVLYCYRTLLRGKKQYKLLEPHFSIRTFVGDRSIQRLPIWCERIISLTYTLAIAKMLDDNSDSDCA